MNWNVLLLEMTEKKNPTPWWYAVMGDREDCDWGTGSYDFEEAKVMCKAFGADAYIAVIEESNDPICIEEITQDEF